MTNTLHPAWLEIKRKQPPGQFVKHVPDAWKLMARWVEEMLCIPFPLAWTLSSCGWRQFELFWKGSKVKRAHCAAHEAVDSPGLPEVVRGCKPLPTQTCSAATPSFSLWTGWTSTSLNLMEDERPNETQRHSSCQRCSSFLSIQHAFLFCG